jgi:two-component system, cell cycle response regulator
MSHEPHSDLSLIGIEKLPTLPGVAIRLLEAVQDEETSLKDIADILSIDPPLSAEILKLINSPFYGLSVKITSVFHAVSLLGISTVKNTALSFSLIKSFEASNGTELDYSRFWRNSLTAAVAAKLLMERVDRPLAEDAFFLGLLHDIGILVVDQCFAKPELIAVYNENNGLADCEAERQILGFDHMGVGEYIASSWGLPPSFSIPIGFHHCPELLPSRDSRIRLLTRILHLSSLFSELCSGNGTALHLRNIQSLVEAYGLSGQIDTDEIATSVVEQTHHIFPVFQIKAKAPEEYFYILESARLQLIHLSNNIVKQVMSQQKEIDTLKTQVTIDGMTGLINHRHFLDVLTQEISYSLRYNKHLSLIFCDIDHFKSVNDLYGHLTGDKVLVEIAQTLKYLTRESDKLSRYGGEEFAILLPETVLESAMMMAERIRKAISSLNIMCDDHLVKVTMSFGISTLMKKQPNNTDDLIKRADHALYQAKSRGRNKCCSYDNPGAQTP